jgi:hypothetical protein
VEYKGRDLFFDWLLSVGLFIVTCQRPRFQYSEVFCSYLPYKYGIIVQRLGEYLCSGSGLVLYLTD